MNSSLITMKTVKCVLVGDVQVGKTCLLTVYTADTFLEEYAPTVFDNYTADFTVDRKPVTMSLWDTSGNPDYEHLRAFQFPQADVFIICFSLVTPSSLENAHNMWYPDIRYHCPNAPVLLVGTKLDLRDEEPPEMIKESQAKGNAVANEIQAFSYLECSARTSMRLKQVFQDAVRAALCTQKTLKPRKIPGGRCCEIL